MSASPEQSSPAATDEACTSFYRPEGFCPEDSIGYLMRQILNAMAQEVQRGLGDEHPTMPQWQPLYKIFLGHANTAADLARACQLDAGGMTRLLDRLEAKGLCRRVRSAADRRIVHVELTEAGRSAAQMIPAVLSRVQDEHLAGFSAQEWQQLQGFLQRILGNATAIAGRMLGINPFDQPDVESAKVAARGLLDARPEPSAPAFAAEGVEVRVSDPALAASGTVAGVLDALWARLPEDGYVSIQAYVDRLRLPQLQGLRELVAADSGRPTTFGWGPRFLH